MSHSDNQTRAAFLRYGHICELFIGKQYSMKNIATLLNIDINTVSKALTRYFNKPDKNTTLASYMNNNKLYVKFMWDKKSRDDIAKDLNINPRNVSKIAYKLGLPYKKSNRTKHKQRIDQRITCLIFNEETGIYYYNIYDCANAYSIKRTTLRDYFSGRGNNVKYNKFKMLSKSQK